MYCPECEKNEETRRAYVVKKKSSPVNVKSYYDHEGHLHVHNKNIVTTKYECPKGHVWSEDSVIACWCGWPEVEEPAKEVMQSVPLPKRVRSLLEELLECREDTDLFDKLNKLLYPKIRKPDPGEPDSIDIDDEILNTYALPGAHNFEHDLAKRRNANYARVYESKRLVQFMKSMIEDKPFEHVGPEHPILEVLSSLERTAEAYQTRLSDKEKVLIEEALLVDRENELADKERAEFRLFDLEQAARFHQESCLEREAFCPAHKLLQHALGQYRF